MTRSLLLFATLCATQLACSNDCERGACDAFSKRAAPTSIPQGIAGTVALESGALVSGCPLCALSASGLDVWASQLAVREPGAACPLAVGPATRNVEAVGRYQHALEPGEYVVCLSAQRGRPCIGVTVAAGQVTTVNIKHFDDSTMWAILDPGSATFRSDAFECPRPGA